MSYVLIPIAYMGVNMFHGNENGTIIFSVRSSPDLAKRSADLAKRRGLAGRSSLVVELLQRELATEAGDDVPAQQNEMEVCNAQPA